MEHYPLVLEQKIKIYSYLVGEDMVLTVPSLLSLIQEISSEHVDMCNIGWRKLKSSNLYWMLSKLYIKVERMPQWSENVLLRTWNKLHETITAYRDYEMVDENGNKLLVATSSWIIFDANSGKIKRLNEFDNNLIAPGNKVAIDENAPKIPKIELIEDCKYNEVLPSDIDVNKHVNNSNYIKWALDTIPNMYKNNFTKLKDVVVNYLGQAKIGELYGIVSKKIASNKYITSIFSKYNKNEYCRIQSTWEEEK